MKKDQSNKGKAVIFLQSNFSMVFLILFVIFSSVTLCTGLSEKPSTAKVSTENDLQNIDLSAVMGNSLSILQGESFEIDDFLTGEERYEIFIPRGLGFSSQQFQLENAGIEFHVEGNELDSHNEDRTVVLEKQEGAITLNLTGLQSGEYQLEVRGKEQTRIIELTVSSQSLLSKDLLTGDTPAIPTKKSIPQFRSGISLFSVNPTPPVSVADVDLTNYFGFVGSSYVDSDNTNVVLPFAPEAKGQTTAIWSKSQIDLTKDFSTEMFAYMYSSGTLADGITFTLHNDPRGVKTIGGAGIGIGAYSTNYSTGDAHIENALTVELDPYSNSGGSNNLYNFDQNVGGQHIGILRPGTRQQMRNQSYHNTYGDPIQNITLNANKWRLLTISWTASTKILQVTYSEIDSMGNPTTSIGQITSKPLDVETLFGGTNVYWGYTAASGALSGKYYMAMKKMPELSVGTITKKVRNETKGETTFSEEITAKRNETVEYELSFYNNNSIYNLTNLTFTDAFDSTLQTYTPNTTTYEKYNTSGTLVSSGSVSDSSWSTDTFSYNIGTVAPDEKVIVKFKASTKAANVHKSKILNDFRISSTTGVVNLSNQSTINLETEYTITEKFVDQNGVAIPTVTDRLSTIAVGENFSSVYPKVAGYSIDGYKIDEAAKISATPTTNVSVNNIQKDYTITYIYDNRMKVGIRQEIKNTNENVVIPSKGYVQLKNNDINSVGQVSTLINGGVIISGKEGTLSTFTTLYASQSSDKQGLLIQPIIPEYYKYVGWGDGINTYAPTTPIQLGYETNKYYQIIIYLEPITDSPAFYGWEYGNSNNYQVNK